MPKEKSLVPKQQTAEIPEGVMQFYANAMNILVTPWDVVLLFGSIKLPEAIAGIVGTSGASKEPPIRIDAAVIMSPQHAKATANALQHVVTEYEKQYGKIGLPEVK